MEFHRRRFIQMIGLAVSGTFVPEATTGAHAALVSAVRDKYAETARLARLVTEVNHPDKLVARAMREERVGTLTGFLLDNFPDPSVDELGLLFKQASVRSIKLGEAELRMMSENVVPVGVMMGLMRSNHIFRLGSTPNVRAFSRRFGSTIMAAAEVRAA